MVYDNSDILAVLEDHEHAGGEAYDGKLHPSDADTEVSSASGLESAVNSSADIIAVSDGEYEITNLEIGDKTIVGYRGWNGSDGAIIYTNESGPGGPYRFPRNFHSANGGCRVTGLRFRGPDPADDFFPYPGDTRNLTNAIKIRGPGGEVDNCEMWGYPWCNVHLRAGSSRATAEVHHNYFHKSLQIGYGYSVNCWANSYTDIHHNYMDFARHFVNGRGNHNIDYEVHENIFGPRIYSHMVDMHCMTENGIGSNSDPFATDYHLRAGGRMEVYNNTFCTDDNNAIGLRGYPWHGSRPTGDGGMIIHNNRFVHGSRPSSNPNSNSPGPVWYANNMTWSGVSSYPPRDDEGYPANWNDFDNQFGAPEAEWSPEYGASVNLLGETPDPTADFIVNTIEEGGEWLEDGIEDVEVTLHRL